MSPTGETPRRSAGSRSLYRAILSLAVAAVIAASLPFAAIYASTVSRPQAIAALAPSSSGGKQVKLVTTASGRQVAVPASGNAAASTGVVPVTTRTSGSQTSD